MFDFIRRLFGEGKVRVSFTTVEGRNGAMIIDYLGDPKSIDMGELEQHTRDKLLVEHGLHMKTFKFVGITTS